MSRMATRIFCLLAFAVSLIMTPLWADDAPQSTAPKFLPAGKLRVGINPQQPPLIFRQGEKIAGLEASFARGFANELGVPLTFVVMDFNQLIPALNAGKIDIIMSGMTATELRQVKVSFTKPYLVTGQMPLVRAGDVNRYPTTFALKNAQGRIGVEEGTTGDFLVRENFLYAERVPFDNIDDAADALVQDRVDMVMADAPTTWWLAASRESAGLSPIAAVLTREQIAWAVDKSNPELLAAANAYLNNLQAQGELDKKIAHWLPFVKQ